MENIVRIQKINIENLKNIENGKITFESYKNKKYLDEKYTADILGIYGQNGSGKTGMIEGIGILKSVLEGEKIDSEMREILSKDKITKFEYEFLVDIQKERYLVSYKFEIKWDEELEVITIIKEQLAYRKIEKETKEISKKRKIIEFNREEKEKNAFGPIKNFNLIDKEKETELLVIKGMSKEKGESFIFNKRIKGIFQESFIEEEKIYFKIIESLIKFGEIIFVIKNNDLAQIDINAFMPINFTINKKEITRGGILPIKLFEPNMVRNEIFELLDEILKQINIVLKSLIPGLEIKIKVLREELMKNLEVAKTFELVSVRNNIEIPLKYESEGIKKIIAILSALIEMYNNEGACVVIDELDSGIFEFLLGEILEVLKERGKGQLIFTSHNLRALEVLDKGDIICTTVNPENRYIKLKGVKNSNNLRDFYLREIFLGGQDEEIYQKTKSYAINRAFRKAGEIIE